MRGIARAGLRGEADAARMRKRAAETTCQSADRDVPALVCGYPLPCPYHSVVVVIERKRGRR